MNEGTRLGFKATQDLLSVYGMTLRRTVDGEYRVNFYSGTETTAYYTDDLDDAFTTAIDMFNRRSGRNQYEA